MLLQHAWLAPMAKPETITEEEEEEVHEAIHAAAGEAAGDKGPEEPAEMIVDQEVADWVKNAIERRKSGLMKGVQKPALHAAPLDAVPSPSINGTNAMETAVPAEATA